MFTHYGAFIHQYCATRDYQYDSFKEVKEYFKAKESIIKAAKNPSIIYPKKDAEYIFDQTFSLLKKCVKNKNQYLTILMDPESIDIPVNSLVVGDEYEYHWFIDK